MPKLCGTMSYCPFLFCSLQLGFDFADAGGDGEKSHGLHRKASPLTSRMPDPSVTLVPLLRTNPEDMQMSTDVEGTGTLARTSRAAREVDRWCSPPVWARSANVGEVVWNDDTDVRDTIAFGLCSCDARASFVRADAEKLAVCEVCCRLAARRSTEPTGAPEARQIFSAGTIILYANETDHLWL